MKIFFRFLTAAALTTAATGCDSFLDINENPNQATSVTPDAQLASALAVTAGTYTGENSTFRVSYNTYASFVAGYWGKSGTVSGFSEEQTYNYTNTYNAGLWSSTYDNLNDYNLIQQNGTANGYQNHAAIGQIMKVYNFLLLVDQYGDIPYTNALKGTENTVPSYDRAEDIYRDFVVQLKAAVANIDAAGSDARPVGAEDIVFRGNMTKWKQFANSLRLRILLRESQVPSLEPYIRTEMTALQSEPDGFIMEDVLVQPGYTSNTNQQNPFYNRYGFAVGLTRPTSEYSFVMPTNYIIRQYESNDDPRITQLYRPGQVTINGVVTPAYVGTDLGEASPPTFNPANDVVGSRFLQGGAFLRGANAPTVLMLLSEHLFNKAEAETRGLFTGGNAAAKTDFLDGIRASFEQVYRGNTANISPSQKYEEYIAANVTNPLVNYDLAPSSGDLGKQAVIIYQKYLAANTVASTEAWADYRRTGLPDLPASLRSASPRADRLPTRLLYPQSEISTNQGNVPTGITQFTPLFWDVVD